MKIKVDLHCHGPQEWFNTLKWNPIDLAKVVEGKLDVVAITECNPDDNRFEDLKMASLSYEKEGRVYVLDNQIYVPESNILFIRSQEIPTWSNVNTFNWRLNSGPQGHVLVFGGYSKISPGSLEHVLDDARDLGAVVIADHMFAGPQDALAGIGYFNSEEVLRKYISEHKLHAVEDSGLLRSKGLINTVLRLNSVNEKALKFARDNDLPVVANSDAHSSSEMGRAHTEVRVFDDVWQHYLPMIKYAIVSKDENLFSVPKSAPLFSSEKHALALIPYMLKK